MILFEKNNFKLAIYTENNLFPVLLKDVTVGTCSCPIGTDSNFHALVNLSLAQTVL